MPAGSGGRTVLAHLAATYRHSTIDDWAERIGRGEVVVDEVVAAPDAILRAGQRLVWHRPPWQEAAVPEHFDVIHEDEAIVAVVKPSGLPTMPAGGFVEHTLLALVRARYPEASPLHRLGRFTSGLVLFARTRSAAATLSRAWRERDVKKYYRALGTGLAALDTFNVDAPIGRVPHPTLGDVYAASPEGKPSHSIATVLERRHPIKGCPTESLGRWLNLGEHSTQCGADVTHDSEGGRGRERDPGHVGIDIDVDKPFRRDKAAIPERGRLAQVRAEHQHTPRLEVLEVTHHRCVAGKTGDTNEERIVFRKNALAAR